MQGPYTPNLGPFGARPDNAMHLPISDFSENCAPLYGPLAQFGSEKVFCKGLCRDLFYMSSLLLPISQLLLPIRFQLSRSLLLKVTHQIPTRPLPPPSLRSPRAPELLLTS